MSSYDFIYQLKPKYECEPGWWKLRWRPIRRGTWNVWARTMGRRSFGLGFFWWETGAHNGWGRAWSGRELILRILWWEWSAWIRWNIRVMAEGPLDDEQKRPLNLSGVPPHD